jgi:hypothetical protein
MSTNTVKNTTKVAKPTTNIPDVDDIKQVPETTVEVEKVRKVRKAEKHIGGKNFEQYLRDLCERDNTMHILGYDYISN